MCIRIARHSLPLFLYLWYRNTHIHHVTTRINAHTNTGSWCFHAWYPPDFKIWRLATTRDFSRMDDTVDAFFGCDPKPVLELAGWKMIWLSRAQRKVAKAIWSKITADKEHGTWKPNLHFWFPYHTLTDALKGSHDLKFPYESGLILRAIARYHSQHGNIVGGATTVVCS